MKKLLLYTLIATVVMSMATMRPHVHTPLPYHGFKYFNPGPPPPTYVEKDTTMTVSATKTFKFRYCAPDFLVSQNGTDSAEQLIISYQGATEATNDQYGDANLTKYGILDYKHAGWDGGITIGNGTHYNNIYINVSQQPPYGTNATGWQWNIDFVKKIAQRFRVRTVIVRGIKKKSIGLAGLSAGGDVIKSMIIYDTLFARDYITAIWSVEGVYPDATPVSNLAAAARNGVRAFFTDGGNDSWNQSAQRDIMNAAVPGSAGYYITTSGEAMWGHGNWNYVFGGDGDGTNRTPKVFPASAFSSGISQIGWQWMLRQTDTTFFSNASGVPIASAGPDQTIWYSKPSVTLDGSASVDGNGTITSYSWTKISGPASYSLSGPSWLVATASNLVQGTYGFKLTVTDNDGNSASDTTYVTVQAPPAVTPGANQQVNGTSATMAASATDEGSVVRSHVQIFKVPGQPLLKIGFVGSSTGYGYGVSPDSTIEYLLNQSLQALGLSTTNIVNLSVTSTDFWNGLWTGTPYSYSGAHAPDTSKNETALFNRGCNLIIWLYTTNTLDDPNLTWATFYDAYKKARDSAHAHGLGWLGITPKTRDGFSPSEEQRLHDWSDSLLKYMPDDIVDVWHGFTASPTTTATRPEINLDGVHWNGAGHVQAVKQIVEKLAAEIRSLYATSATVTTPTSLTTTVTGLSQGTYTMLVSSKDNDSLWNNATMTITDTSVATQPSNNCNTGTPTIITLSPTAPGEIYLPDGGQGVNALKGNDEIRIPAGSYDVISLGAINGDIGCPVKITTTNGGIVDTKIFRLAEHRNSPATHIWIHGRSGYSLKIGSSTTYQDGAPGHGPSSNGLAASYWKDLFIDSVEVRKTAVGMYPKPIVDQNNPLTLYGGWSGDTLEITNCYIHDIVGEGIYAGDTYPNADPYAGNATPARISHVHIHHNIVDSTGWDGIQLSNARNGNRIDHNTVTNFGLQNAGGQQAGIIMGGNSTGDVDSNTVRFGTGNGIQNFGYGNINIYSNTVEATGYDGTVNGQQSMFGTDFNSTVESNPNKKVNYHDNVIIHPKYINGILRENADNSLTDSIYYVNNQVCFDVTAPASWQTNYLMSAATHTVNSGNTEITCGNNQAPTANAGSNQTIYLPNTSITLSGSGSDVDGTIASYAWAKTSGASVTVNNASAATTTVTGLTAGTYVFTLTVTDNLGATATANVTVVVLPAPVHFYKQILQSKIN